MLAKTDGKRTRGWQGMRRLDSILNLMDMNLSKLQETMRTEEPGVLQSKGLQRVGCDSGAEHTHTYSTISVA